MKYYPFGKPILNSSRYLKDFQSILKSGRLVHGKNIEKFENSFAKYTNAKSAISVSSCTTGMTLFYHSIGIKSGDEIILPSQTHVATAHAIMASGAKPIFIDSDKFSGNINLEKISKKITNRTKAITVVHYLGNPVDMEGVMTLAKKHSLFVLEDCALALGAKYKNKHVGLIGDAGFFSFYPVKHITTGEGGMIILNNTKYEKKLKKMRAFGYNKDLNQRSIPGFYDVDDFGFNFRMGEINAALGIRQLKDLDLFLKLRKKNYQFLSDNLKNIKNLRIIKHDYNKKFKSSFYCFTILLDNKIKHKRFEIMKKMNNSGIGTSIYYPKPVPLLKYYKKLYNQKSSNYVNAKYFSDNSICLSVGPHLTLNNIKSMVKIIKNIFKNYK